MIVAILFVSIGALCVYGVYRFFNPFGKVVNEELSDSYYYTRDNKGIVYSPMGNWFSLGKHEMEVDLSTFQVLGRDYAKDENHAYFKSRVINTPVDIPSFEVKSGFMPIDKNHVYVLVDDLYYLDTSEAEAFEVLEGADAQTYEQLSYDFAKDKNFIYRNNEKCTAVDRESFEIINDQFCKDFRGVYHYQYGRPLSKIDGANVSEIVSLTYSCIRDDKNVYFFLSYRGSEYVEEIIKLPFKNSEEIRFFSDYSSLIKIDNNIYYHGLIIDGVDASTFEELKYGYTKDKDHVFFNWKIIEEADVNTFKYNERKDIFSDKNHIYEEGKVVKSKR
ncbi:DKNYY domain-containing protein [uncultured Aquimarina sp.]|uniref:DKNYY domain-containing protein n=1 Tax=uncultured Aquimarina sp. TaxID=575652 RepID=UPI0026173066|nr:DKNYY domain-containing protein [uncultured Aquimarina sp.]